jgi:hypothetical protein
MQVLVIVDSSVEEHRNMLCMNIIGVTVIFDLP